MISANELRDVNLTKVDNGYSVEEVNAVINAAADTIDAYVNENKELYRKMELLASKIEEYREEEDSIKSALITAQKMADKITKESNDAAAQLKTQSEATASQTVAEANEKAEKLVSEARDYAASIVKEKTDEANAIIADAEKKANDAINSSKIVAQNILDQAKEISDDLISKSKEEKEAYETLSAKLKNNAQEFIASVSALYIRQLEELKSAKLETGSDSDDDVKSIQDEVDSLKDEMDEMENAIPTSVSIESVTEAEPEETEEADEAPAGEIPSDPSDYEIITDEEDDFEEIDDEPTDPMKAVEAFSQNEISPIDRDALPGMEITEDARMQSDEDKSLFDEDDSQLPFESYFHVKKEDAHGDKTQTISLVPPEDDDNDPKFKGFFGKKKK